MYVHTWLVDASAFGFGFAMPVKEKGPSVRLGRWKSCGVFADPAGLLSAFQWSLAAEWGGDMGPDWRSQPPPALHTLQTVIAFGSFTVPVGAGISERIDNKYISSW